MDELGLDLENMLSDLFCEDADLKLLRWPGKWDTRSRCCVYSYTDLDG